MPLRPEQSLLALPFMKTDDLRQSIVKLGNLFDRKGEAAALVEQLKGYLCRLPKTLAEPSSLQVSRSTKRLSFTS